MFSSDVRYLNKLQVFAVQIMFGVSIILVSHGFNDDNTELAAKVALFIVYLYVTRGSSEAILVAYNLFVTKSVGDLPRLYKNNQNHFAVFAAAVGFLVYRQTSLLKHEFILFYIASLVVKYPDMEKQKRVVSYGTGMACSFYEGYLAHMLPSDGHKFVGFEENIRVYEANESVRFPVRRLFIIITKDLYCPPDLKAFNKVNRPDLPSLEACKSLESVIKSVAGVRNRVYKNSAYKIHRPDGGGDGSGAGGGAGVVYCAAECATPLHTLHLVLHKRALYKELEGINKEEVVGDFCSMLTTILRSPEVKGKCELVYFDNTEPEANLAQVLLDRIREIEPNFEEIIRRRDE